MSKQPISNQELYNKLVDHVHYGNLSWVYNEIDENGNCAYCAKGFLIREGLTNMDGDGLTKEQVVMANKFENLVGKITAKKNSLSQDPLIHGCSWYRGFACCGSTDCPRDAVELVSLDVEEQLFVIAKQHNLEFLPKITDADESIFKEFNVLFTE